MFGKKRIAELEAQLAELQGQIRVLALRVAKSEKEAGGLAELYSGVANSHAHEIKRVNDLQEQARLAGRKKVRRRDPQTGRFESVYEDELESE